MMINSTELLEILKHSYGNAGDHVSIPIADLAGQVGITVPKLISVLTELEQRDQIILNVTTYADPDTGELSYDGSIRMMSLPADEIEADISSGRS